MCQSFHGPAGKDGTDDDILPRRDLDHWVFGEEAESKTMNAAVLEFTHEHPAPAPGRAGEEAGAAVANKIEALKILATALLRGIEELERSHPQEHGRICLQDEMRRYETDIIRCALIRTGGRQRRAARLLGMNVATLNHKIKRYNLLSDVVLNAAQEIFPQVKGSTESTAYSDDERQEQ